MTWENVHYDSCPLGHEKLETTARYTRVATGLITAVESPLDRLSAPGKAKRKKGKAAA
jgi:integrase/recombinase XerD